MPAGTVSKCLGGPAARAGVPWGCASGHNPQERAPAGREKPDNALPQAAAARPRVSSAQTCHRRGRGATEASPGGAGNGEGWQVLVCPPGTWSKVLMAKAETGAGARLCQARGATSQPRQIRRAGVPSPRPAGGRAEGALSRSPGHSSVPRNCRERCRFHQPLPLTASLTPCRPPWTFPALASRLFPGCGCRVARAAGVPGCSELRAVHSAGLPHPGGAACGKDSHPIHPSHLLPARTGPSLGRCLV